MSSSETEDGGCASGQGTGFSPPNAIIEQDLITGVASPISKSTSFRFLRLPKELRDKVYEGLLCPHIDGAKYQGFTRVRDYDLQPAILRANKQIHKEASDILYKQNRTAIITLDKDVWTVLKKNGFRWALPVTWLKHGKAGALPMLTIDMTVHSECNVLPAKRAARKGEANGRRVFIGFLSAVYSICRRLMQVDLADHLQLAVRLERPVGESLLEELLDPFREVRGTRRAIITGVQLSTSMELTTLMETPIAHPNELLERANVYKFRARRQMREQKWNEARDTLENAVESVSDSWNFRSKFEGWGMDKSVEFNIMEIDLRSIYIECCVKVGRTVAAHRGLEELFRLGAYRPREDGYELLAATKYYNLGMVFCDKGHLNAAAYSFLQALREFPGHQSADEAVDTLEHMVEGSEDPDHVVAALNIKHTLTAFRHKTGWELSDEESERIVRGFIGTIGEMQSLFHCPSTPLVTERTFLVRPES